MKPVKLAEWIEAIECDSEEHITKIDLRNGCVVAVERALIILTGEQ